MKRTLSILALSWLIFLAAFAGGVVTAERKTWPYPLIQEWLAFIAGHAEERTTLGQKLQNDLGLAPARHLVTPAALAHPDAAYRPLSGIPLRDRRAPPRVYLDPAAPRGYRVIVGTFDMTEGLHGAVLLDPDGAVQRVWPLSQQNVAWPHEPDTNVFPHGFAILPDGAVIAAFDSGASLVKYDYCGREQWRLKGLFHHSITLDGAGNLWTWGRGEHLKQVRVADGRIVRSFTIPEIMQANPEIDIFGIRQQDDGKRSKWAKGGGGRFHANDIDPLPAERAARFPGFVAGDLLISVRSINLVFVLDPDSLKVKWWRQGLTRRPHDADWSPRGVITIYDNNMHRKPSRIVEVDPATMTSRVLVDGARHDFYTWHRGKHQELPGGHMLITSPQQGRVFEVASDGAVTFDFHNFYDDGKRSLVVSEGLFLPPDYFRELPSCAE
jgi:hypothetical protein